MIVSDLLPHEEDPINAFPCTAFVLSDMDYGDYLCPTVVKGTYFCSLGVNSSPHILTFCESNLMKSSEIKMVNYQGKKASSWSVRHDVPPHSVSLKQYPKETDF